MKQIFSYLYSKKYYILIIIALIAGGYYFYSKNTSGDGQYIHLVQGSLVNEVNIAGKVVSSKNVDLSFETGGTVDSVYKEVGDKVNKGDMIVALDSSELRANLAKAEAGLSAEQAKLDQLQSNQTSTTEVTTAKQNLQDAIVNGFTSADDAIRNKVDQFFTDPDTMNPKILFAFNDYDLKEKINAQRIVVEETLKKWEKLNAGLSGNTVSNASADEARGYLSTIKTFLNDVSRAVNNFEPNNTLSQTTIDKYKSDVALARTNINNSLSALTSVQEGVRSTSSGKSVQEANVKSAQAAVAALGVQIEKTYIRAPFAGVVSVQDAKVGQAVSAHTNLASLISDGYEIEAYIPELNISGVAVKNKARVTLDAFGPSVEWGVNVIKIDPAETVKDGVATYKVRFAFDTVDNRVKSGMTANIKIETSRKDNITYLPLRTIINQNGKNYVTVHIGKNNIQKEVVVGDRDSRGNVEIISGVSTNDDILLNP